MGPSRYIKRYQNKVGGGGGRGGGGGGGGREGYGERFMVICICTFLLKLIMSLQFFFTSTQVLQSDKLV